jgi:hypothetical protein
MMFMMAFTSFALPPGKSREFKVTWDQIGDDGKLVPAGKYTVNAWLPVRSGTKPKAAPISIRIEP